MKKTVAVSFAVLVAARVVVACRLDLFGDEAFYWQCAQRLAPAFVDHPPLTALLVRAGCGLLGDTRLGVRILFLGLTAAIPWAVLWMAAPLVGRRDAWWAAVRDSQFIYRRYIGLSDSSGTVRNPVLIGCIVWIRH